MPRPLTVQDPLSAARAASALSRSTSHVRLHDHKGYPWEVGVLSTLQQKQVCPYCVSRDAQETFIRKRVWLARRGPGLVVLLLIPGVCIMLPPASAAFMALTVAIMLAPLYPDLYRYLLCGRSLYLFKDREGRVHCEAIHPNASQISRERDPSLKQWNYIVRLTSRPFGRSGVVDAAKGRYPATVRVRLSRAHPLSDTPLQFASPSVRLDGIGADTLLRLVNDSPIGGADFLARLLERDGRIRDKSL